MAWQFVTCIAGGHEHTIVRSQLLGKPKITDSAKFNTNKKRKMKEFAEGSINENPPDGIWIP